MTPILVQIDEHHLVLNFDQFFLMAEKQRLNVAQRHAITGPKRVLANHINNYSFKVVYKIFPILFF